MTMVVHGQKSYRGVENGVPPSRRDQMLELSTFLLLIVPSMVLSFFAVKQGGLSFLLTAWATIFRDLGLVALIFYFLRRNGEPVSSIGWTSEKRWKEVGLGLALFLPFTLGGRPARTESAGGGVVDPRDAVARGLDRQGHPGTAARCPLGACGCRI